jgi:hypothetical protein
MAITELDRSRKRESARARPPRSNSGIKGVTYAKDRGRWKAYIHLPSGVVRSLGYHDKLEDAAAARKAAEARFYPEEKVKKTVLTLANCWNPLVIKKDPS